MTVAALRMTVTAPPVIYSTAALAMVAVAVIIIITAAGRRRRHCCARELHRAAAPAMVAAVAVIIIITAAGRRRRGRRENKTRRAAVATRRVESGYFSGLATESEHRAKNPCDWLISRLRAKLANLPSILLRKSQMSINKPRKKTAQKKLHGTLDDREKPLYF